MEPVSWTAAEVEKAKDACAEYTDFNSRLTCGPCVLPSKSGVKDKVILISAARPENLESFEHSLELKRVWRASVILHVNDEFNAAGVHTPEDIDRWSEKLALLYKGVDYVWRTYPPPNRLAVTNMVRNNSIGPLHRL